MPSATLVQSKGKNCSVAKISEFFRFFLDFFGFFWNFFEVFQNFSEFSEFWNFSEFFGIFRKLVRFARPPEDYSPIVLRAPNIFQSIFCRHTIWIRLFRCRAMAATAWFSLWIPYHIYIYTLKVDDEVFFKDGRERCVLSAFCSGGM